METYQLDPVEIRVLGALVEKQALTPDAYPITLNGLLGACNQLTSRDPVMQLDETDVARALDSLIQRRLAAERLPAGSRVAKYEHRLPYEWNIDGARLAALALLALRGAQTAAEIRARSGRIYAFGGVEEVETALNALADKYPPLTLKLERAPGEREARWVHCLGDAPEAPEALRAADTGRETLEARVAALEAQVARLSEQLARLSAQEGSNSVL
ncbi:YceH family protein [Paludibacterium paludis]|uniref:UPF0502 protein n=1 Tax=Paludibacterium paludis TaxID=1225769 RepID=A0A918P0C3_9NEIS|nr:DUF480 domain-containing protein [Paludibacterium paludis]GGY09497.1 UPF0502 protein [Paludibacterium paludis]